MLDEFYELNKHLYPNLTKEHFIAIAKGPFSLVKHTMKSGILEEIRIKRLGVFRVFPGTTKRIRKNTEDYFKRKLIPEKEYNRLINMIDNYENELQRKS